MLFFVTFLLLRVTSIDCSKALTGLILYHRSVPARLPAGSCLYMLYFSEHDGSNITLKQIITNPIREKHTSYLFNLRDEPVDYQAIQINLNVGWCSDDGGTRFLDLTSGPLEKGSFTPSRTSGSSGVYGPAILLHPGYIIL